MSNTRYLSIDKESANPVRHPESGMAVVLMSLVLIAVIGVVAMVVDLGRSMRSQTHLKTAMDAGALRAAQALWGDKTNSEAETIAREIVEANLIAYGHDAAFVSSLTNSLTVSFSGSDSEVSLGANHPISYFFAQAIPGVGDRMYVRAVSKARMTQRSESIVRVPASFTFVLDKSGSMGEMDSSGQQKIRSLKNAVKHLIDQSNLDEYRFTTYDTSCGSTSPAFDLTRSQDKTDAENWIDAVFQGGWTNIACGLQRAYNLQSSAIHDAKAVILLTDGVANRGTYSTECCSAPHGGAVCWADKIKTDLKVPVFTIGFGNNANFDAPFLQRVAGTAPGNYGCNTATDSGPESDPPGDYLEAPDENALKEAFENIIQQVSSSGEDKWILIPSETEL